MRILIIGGTGIILHFQLCGREKHISNYMSLFGHDIEAGETASARSRLVVLPNPTEAEILGIADAFYYFLRS